MHAFLTDETGATAIEYGLLAALVAIVLVSGLTVFATGMDSMYSSFTGTVDDAMAGTPG